MLPEVLNWDELQSILQAYDTVFVLAHLKGKTMSIRTLALVEEYAGRTPGARFLQFDSATPQGIEINGKLDVKFCPKLLAFSNGVQVASYIGDKTDQIEAVLNKIATVEEIGRQGDWEVLESTSTG